MSDVWHKLEIDVAHSIPGQKATIRRRSRRFAGTGGEATALLEAVKRGQKVLCWLCDSNGVLWGGRWVTAGHLASRHAADYAEYKSRHPTSTRSATLQRTMREENRAVYQDEKRSAGQRAGLEMGRRRPGERPHRAGYRRRSRRTATKRQ